MYFNIVYMLLTIVRLLQWISDSYCSLKPLWSGVGEVVSARTSPTLHPPSPPTVLLCERFQQLCSLSTSLLSTPCCGEASDPSQIAQIHQIPRLYFRAQKIQGHVSLSMRQYVTESGWQGYCVAVDISDVHRSHGHNTLTNMFTILSPSSRPFWFSVTQLWVLEHSNLGGEGILLCEQWRACVCGGGGGGGGEGYNHHKDSPHHLIRLMKDTVHVIWYPKIPESICQRLYLIAILMNKFHWYAATISPYVSREPVFFPYTPWSKSHSLVSILACPFIHHLYTLEIQATFISHHSISVLPILTPPCWMLF